MKKTLFLLLTFCFVLSLQAAIAEEVTFDDAGREDSAATVLSELGIMMGDENGNLNEENKITRAEFAVLVSRVAKESSDKKDSCFYDVDSDHWAAAAVCAMTEKGIICGYDDGGFGPNDDVTLSQAVKILLGILEKNSNGFSYPNDYLLTGAKEGLTKGINEAPNSSLTRQTAAKLIINALYIPQEQSKKMLIERADVPNYYVSAKGNDDGNGSFLNPWKTLSKAAGSVSGRAIIYLDEGVYTEREPAVFIGGNSSNEPLIVRARYGQNAKIVYEDIGDNIIISENADFVIIENLNFTTHGSIDGGIIVDCTGNNFSFKNNKVEGLSIKVENAENSIIESNMFKNGKNAVLLNNARNAVVIGNAFEGQSESMLKLYGNTKNTKIYNNNFNVNDITETTAISIGNEENDCYVQACAALNNVIYNNGKTLAATAISMTNTENCYFYNNIVDSTNGAVCFIGQNINTVLKNNIYMDCSDSTYIVKDAPEGFDSDYNCFCRTYPEIKEANSIFADPVIVSRGTDWHLMENSPAVSRGTVVQAEMIGTKEGAMVLDLSDVDGNERTGNWHMGIYAVTSAESAISGEDSIDMKNVMLFLDFKSAPDHLIASGGEWTASGGAYYQSEADGARMTVCYDGGEDWTNYEYSADVEAPNGTEGHASGIIFRSDLEMKNMYTFRFLTYDTLEFAKWQNNSFASIEKWEFPFELDSIYNLKVEAVGNNFTFYVNGEKVRNVQDNSYMSGTVGLYCYRETNQYDNMRVVKID